MSDEPTRECLQQASLVVSATNALFEGLLKAGALEAPPRPGLAAALDRYEVIDIIGQGGMGVVLLARNPATDTRVAVKMLRPDAGREPQMVKRFLTEARHMYRLDHPNIMRVLDVCDRPTGPYYVMPYKQRGSLAGMLQPGQPLDAAPALYVARQVAEALAYAHAQGLIHRDVKPHNILLDADGRAQLADFGLVRTVFNDSLIEPGREGRLGTLAYMSPAVARGEAEDTRCDIYSFGAVLYEMLTGEPPYSGQTREAVLNAILAGPPVPLDVRNPKAAPGLVTVCEGCMARELRDRYATMDDVARDLRLVAHQQSPLGPHGQPKSARRRLWSRASYGVAITAAIVALAAYWGHPKLARLATREAGDKGGAHALTRGPISSGDPRLVRTYPLDGAADVDPGTSALSFEFDQSMAVGNYEAESLGDYTYPNITGTELRPPATVVRHVSLKPNERYGLRFRASSAGGALSDWCILRFATGPGGAAPVAAQTATSPPGAAPHASDGPCPARLYVDSRAKGRDDGTTWGNAFKELRDALARAERANGAVQEIWVAKGTYTPAAPSGARDSSFRLLKKLALYGGFAGNETRLEQRPGDFSGTVLSGDLQGDDDSRAFGGNNNAYHVLSAIDLDSTAIVDGFTITHGVADGAELVGQGGGLLCERSQPTIKSCIFSKNRAAARGGALAALGSRAPSFEQCEFVDNESGDGGALFVDSGACTLANSTLRTNRANEMGDAIACTDVNLELVDCRLAENSASHGGAVQTMRSRVEAKGCSFERNTARGNGGAINNYENDPVVELTACRFDQNQAGGDAGAVQVGPDGRLAVRSCLFRRNSAHGDGGAVHKFRGTVIAVNTVFVGNRAGKCGGAIERHFWPACGEIVNCTFAGNRADEYAGGAIRLWWGPMSVHNCLFADNVDGGKLGQLPEEAKEPLCIGGALFSPAVQDMRIDYSCLPQAGTITNGEHNIDAACLTGIGPGPDGVYGTDDDELTLALGSPCIDAGCNEPPRACGVMTLPEYDLGGNPRIVNGRVDIGAYEYQGQGTATSRASAPGQSSQPR